ncbi:MAG TPA: hypothetical protein VG890_14160 [Puia sp.]|nr:hypothetical protein [Puia sp.]
MKFLPACLIIFLSITFYGCVQPNYNRLWFFTYDVDKSPVNKTGLTPASFLELRPDKTFTRDFGRFEYGTWEINGNRLLLSNQFGDKIAVAVRYMKGNNMQLIPDEFGTVDFEGQALPAAADDPFSLKKNRWRLKATAHESTEQLGDRLKNHFAFWESYFRWALENHITYIDVRSTPTPIKIYGNGFTIKPFDDLPQEWKSFFYDSVDCRQANAILEDLVKKNNIAWAHTDNKYKMFISAFQQLQQFVP